ncbi:hypothetical protein K432DRAFT_380136 [Lepidopterella palustris CBS 459.81]|uniref:FAR-17a/AIG1-like protein n=1 Tax=Lepidopterella palustris CBS 459.81 TaxID=1314670 RepID=A0A8E2EF63_9PEZI|nr:hypothetical protein K432DRAFT_380136 [Lepidopterella palustris CBS 459.81]
MSATGISQALSPKHPLQRLQSPSKGLSAIVHATGLISYSLSFRYLVEHPNIINDSYGWHFQYLTNIGLFLATATFTFGLLADLTNSPRLFSVKNAFAVIAVPLEVLISILYWGLRVINPALVMPAWAPPLIPLADLGFHFNPSFLLAFDFIFLSPPWPTTAMASVRTLVISTLVAFTYWFWIELCYSHNGFYPYPIFSMLDTKWRIMLFAFSGCLMTGSAFGLRSLYGWVNGYDIEKVKGA